MMTDPISDMLTRIRNGYAARKPEVIIPFSKVKFTIARILGQAGYVGMPEKLSSRAGAAHEFKVALLYGPQRAPGIREVKRISKPGRRVYAGYRELSRIASGTGVTIMSTPKGIMTNKEARKMKLGGEILCEVY